MMSSLYSDDLTAKLLQVIVQTLREEVVPAISTREARINADQISRLLYWLQYRHSARGERLEQLLEEEKGLLQDVENFLASSSGTCELPDTGELTALEELEKRLYAVEIAISEKVPELMKLALGNSARKEMAVALIERILDLHKAFYYEQDPDMRQGSRVCYQGGLISEERPLVKPDLPGKGITAESLTEHLQQKFPGCKVEDLSVLAGGLSKETISFTLSRPNRPKESLIIRHDIPIDFISSVAFEFPLLERAFAAGLPVAEPMWLEEDPEPFGGCFMVSRRVSGSNDIGQWASDKAACESFARQLAEVMAKLHSLKLEDFGFAPDIANESAGALTLREVRRWQREFELTRMEAYPTDTVALAWLTSKVPRSLFERPGCLVHGDIGFHNMLMDQGKVMALLDWEFAHPGDPIEDLMYTKPFIEQLMDFEDFKSYYYEFGGVECTEEEEQYYALWSKTRNMLTSTKAVQMWSDHMPHVMKFATAGLVLARYLSPEAGDMIRSLLARDGEACSK